MGDELTATVRRAIDKHGVKTVAKALGLSAEATCRLGGNLPVQNGTRAQAFANLTRLAQLDGGPRAA